MIQIWHIDKGNNVVKKQKYPKRLTWLNIDKYMDRLKPALKAVRVSTVKINERNQHCVLDSWYI